MERVRAPVMATAMAMATVQATEMVLPTASSATNIRRRTRRQSER
jgi:hypothetical protein